MSGYFKKIPFLLLLLSTVSFALTLSTHLDRTEISDGESVNLIISADVKTGLQPDLSPLENDFAVISTSTRTSLRVINGNSQATTTWIVGLIPRKAGEITVPKVKVGDDYTQTIKLTVSEQAKQVSSSKDIFVEVDVEPKEAYVQQQLIYKLRLNTSRSFMNVQFMPPQSNDAKIEPIGHDIRYMSTIGEKAYQVIEKHFLVFPQKSGNITLSAPLFTGEVVEQGQAVTGAGSFFAGFGGFGRAIRLKGEEINLAVKPKPENFSGSWWLPAEKIILEERFSANTKTWKMGEPLTRIITIIATGLLAEQLPDVSFTDIANVNLYPDKPIIKNDIVDGKLIGKKEFRIAMMPNKNGEAILPPVKIVWWNVTKNKEEILTLPEHRLNIVGLKAEKNENNVVAPVLQKSAPNKEKSNYWIWLVAAFLVLSGWGLNFWFWYRSKKPAVLNKKTSLKKPSDPKTAIKMLFDWSQQKWPDNPPVTLVEIARRLNNAEFEDQIDLLEKLQYSKVSNIDWDADEFWVVFQRAIKQKQNTHKASTDPLPDLY